MALKSPSDPTFRLSLALVLCAAALGLPACSSSSNKQGNTAVGGGSAGGGSAAIGGNGGGGGSSNATNRTGFAALAESVGRFLVRLSPADATLKTTATTSIEGVVKDGPEANLYTESILSSEGRCILYGLAVPTCVNANAGGGCNFSTEACTDTDICTKLPTKKNVGTVTVSGVATTSNTDPFALKAVSNSYQVPGEVTLAYPGFSEGAPISVSASGSDYPAFEVSAKGVAPLVLAATSYHASTGESLTVSWTSGGAASDARVEVTLNLSHHGGSVGYIACDVADTGSLTISAAQVSRLIDLGVAGYPTLTVIRRSIGTVTIAPGTVVLSVESSASPAFCVEGYTSCSLSDSSECPSGKTCNTDMKVCE